MIWMKFVYVWGMGSEEKSSIGCGTNQNESETRYFFLIMMLFVLADDHKLKVDDFGVRELFKQSDRQRKI